MSIISTSLQSRWSATYLFVYSLTDYAVSISFVSGMCLEWQNMEKQATVASLKLFRSIFPRQDGEKPQYRVADER
jgi:hypothetical protein